MTTGAEVNVLDNCTSGQKAEYFLSELIHRPRKVDAERSCSKIKKVLEKRDRDLLRKYVLEGG